MGWQQRNNWDISGRTLPNCLFTIGGLLMICFQTNLGTFHVIFHWSKHVERTHLHSGVTKKRNFISWTKQRELWLLYHKALNPNFIFMFIHAYMPTCISSQQSIPISLTQHFCRAAVSSYSRCFSVWAVKDKRWEMGGSVVSAKVQSVRHLCSI